MYFIADWTKRVDYDLMHSERIKSVSEKMGQFDLEGLVTLRIENTRYLTNLRPGWFPYFQIRYAALFMPGKDPICFVDDGDLERRRKTLFWIKDENLRPLPRLDDPVSREKGIRALVQGMEDLGLTKGRVGLDIATLSILNGLQKA